MDTCQTQLDYLRLLAQQYPSIQATSTAIIGLKARLDLAKGTEHFVSDVHGEYEAFRHILIGASGAIRRRIDDVMGLTLSTRERRQLATLIYYPEQKLPLILAEVDDETAWYRATLYRLIKVCRVMASSYPRTTVEDFLPQHFAAIIEELLLEQEDALEKQDYYRSILETIIDTGSARAFIVALAVLIQRLAIARLHMVGDIYDRGPGAHLIMDTLMRYHSVDIQWGNHDVLWMGAAAGSRACIASVIRICLRYGNLETLEDGYGISLLPLASFAMETYGDDPCSRFGLKAPGDQEFTEHERRLMAQMHKAITITQLKLEAQVIRRRPQYRMDDRLLLEKIDHQEGTVRIGDEIHPLLDTHLPTVDPEHPYELTAQEQSVVDRLALSFANSRRLQEHVRFLFSRGSLYLVHNGNLLFHGCIPLHEDGSFMAFKVDSNEYAAQEFMDRLDRLARQGYFTIDDPERKQYGMDAMWYLWSGAQSPLFGKEKMATFERYLIQDPATHVEERNAYYALRAREDIAIKILDEFGLDAETGHIINGHTPVHVTQGETPIKAGGKLIVIDGGLSKAYQHETGIAGYTLVSNSYGLLLAAHQPFESAQKAIEEELDIDSETRILDSNRVQIRVRDTDQGQEIRRRVGELNALLDAYRTGLIKER